MDQEKINSTNTALEELFFQYPPLHFKAEEIVIHPEEPPQGVYFLKKGFIRMYVISPSGREVTLRIYPAGCCLPLTWVLNEQENKYYYEAFTDLMVYRAPKSSVNDLIKINPQVGFELINRELVILHELLARTKYLTLGDAHKKVAAAIVYLAKHFGQLDHGKVYINHWFTHQDIASLAGVVRETASIELDRLRKKGLIEFIQRSIVINDINGLNGAVE